MFVLQHAFRVTPSPPNWITTCHPSIASIPQRTSRHLFPSQSACKFLIHKLFSPPLSHISPQISPNKPSCLHTDFFSCPYIPFLLSAPQALPHKLLPSSPPKNESIPRTMVTAIKKPLAPSLRLAFSI